VTGRQEVSVNDEPNSPFFMTYEGIVSYIIFIPEDFRETLL
jgi:hypothetical protein